MTIMMSCDHHDASGSVPDNRSRHRMLQQFATALTFGATFLELCRQGMEIHISTVDGVPLAKPTIEVDLARFMTCWDAYMLWRAMAPRGDDLVPAVNPPAEIRVPPAPGAD